MEPALKQRLIGGAVLVALAVIFLPMLIKGPAPESGAADVSLDMPAEPTDGMRTVELPLGTPSSPAAPAEADTLPTVDTTVAREGALAASPAPGTAPIAPGAAGGDWAVSFASYATAEDAAKVIAALRAQQLRAWQEPVVGRTGRTVHRVRIGPFAGEAEAEAARIRAGRVGGAANARVIALDAGAVPLADPRAATAAAGSVSTPAPLPSGTTAVAALPADPPTAKPSPAPTAPKPAVAPTPPPAATAATPAPVAAAPAAEPRAAAGTGYAVQVGAFSKAADAMQLRDRLRAAGFSAFVEDVRTDKGTLARVRVGPVATREEATSLRAQVSGKVGVGGDVRPHP